MNDGAASEDARNAAAEALLKYQGSLSSVFRNFETEAYTVNVADLHLFVIR